MASALRFLAVTLLLLLSLITTVVSVEEDELESMLNLLRSRGHNLFSNAISTSDIIYEVISGKSFTFFAPTDSALFTLDMTSAASDYISTLRCHVIPIRLLYPELFLLPSGSSSLPTLVKNHRAIVRLETRSSLTSSNDCITIDGVQIALPDLFYSRNLAVHGLRGYLNCTSVQDTMPVNQSSLSTQPGSVISHSREGNRRHTHPPPPLNFSSETVSNTSGGIVQNPVAPSPSPTNLHDDQGCNSPVVSEGQAKPSQVDGGFPPSHSQAQAYLPPQVSPAFDLWLDAPTATVPSPSTEPGPPPEFSENDDPMSFPPSAIEIQGAHKAAKASKTNSMKEKGKKLPLIMEDEFNNESSDYIPVTAADEMAGIMGKSWEECEPFDETDYECTMVDGLEHVSIPDALPYAYTRQPNPNFGNARMSCCNA